MNGNLCINIIVCTLMIICTSTCVHTVVMETFINKTILEHYFHGMLDHFTIPSMDCSGFSCDIMYGNGDESY